jgi:hypothetical protein
MQMQPAQIQPAQMQASPMQPLQARPAGSHARLLWVVVLLLLVAGMAAAGWWYVKNRAHGPVVSEPIVDPNRQVKAPATDQVPSFKPDPNAPLAPSSPSKPPARGNK